MANIAPIRSQLRFQVLSPTALTEIKAATLTILEDIGVRFPSEWALSTFADHGATVDFQDHIVKLPQDMVLASLSHAPRSYTLAGRELGTELVLNGEQSYFGTDGCGVETIDFETGVQRPSCKQDVAMMARISDYLSSVAFYWPMVSAQDCGHAAPLHELEASFANTVKHIQTETVMGARAAHFAVRMAEVIAGSREQLKARPPLSAMVCTIAPLGQDPEGIEAAMVFAEAGIPVGFMGMPTMGTTAPAVPGGALAVANAEVVSAMVLMQLVAPGAPTFHSILVSAMDPQSAEYIVSTPEKYLCNVAGVEMAHDWGVPALAGTFGVDAEEPATWQLGRDSVYTALLCALAGTDITIGLGMLQASTLLVPEQIIFDDEIYHSHRILSQGLEVRPEEIALDVVAAVGPGGHYLTQEHTRRHIRERWIPGLTHPRQGMGRIQDDDIRSRAKAEVARILAQHHPTPLDDVTQKALDEILVAATEELQPGLRKE